MLAVTGYRSRIVQELEAFLPPGEGIIRLGGGIPVCQKFLLCAGHLMPKRLVEQSEAEMSESLHVNLIRPIQLCEEILDLREDARICVIGSESGFSWSHDDTYAAAKAALHRYVETRKLKPNQQLVCIAPSIIEDGAMTLRRQDTENLERRRENHPKRRFLRAIEVARLVHFLLYVDEGYLSGTVIRMNGGGS